MLELLIRLSAASPRHMALAQCLSCGLSASIRQPFSIISSFNLKHITIIQFAQLLITLAE
jgi:hypothetical protein